MLVSPAYAGIFGVVFAFLSMRILLIRRLASVAIGTGDDPRVLGAVRAHGNFSEYVPIVLLLIYVKEAQGGGAVLIHALCLGLLLGRALHAYGVSQVAENYRFRVAGTVLTLVVVIGVSIQLLFDYLTVR